MVSGERFDAIVDDHGLRATTSGEPLGVLLASWGRADNEQAVRPVEPTRSERLEWHRDGLVEFWRDTPEGFLHGCEIDEPPPGSGPVVLRLSVVGARRWDADRRDALLVANDGSRWRYAGLAAWDADGAPLRGAITATASGFVIDADDAGATYPIVIDPTLRPAGVLSGPDGGERDYFGGSVAGAGDVDGDGYDDVVIGAPGSDDYGQRSGAVYVFFGGTDGLSRDSVDEAYAASPAELEEFGQAVSSAGDVNADGYDDLIIGAADPEDRRAFATVLHGRAGGVASQEHVVLWPSDVNGMSTYSEAVGGAGDLDGDGFSDVIVGARSALDVGAAYVYLGSSAGVLDETGQRLVASDSDDGAWFGFAVSSAGDVNGDGFDDVLVGAPHDSGDEVYSGAAYSYLGGPGGLSSTSELKLSAEDQDFEDSFGWSVSSAGDVNADGYDDVIIGAPLPNDKVWGTGRAHLFLGGESGPVLDSERVLTASDAAEGNHYGEAVAGAGDLDGDGFDDVVVGAPWRSKRGPAYIYLGSSTGVDASSERSFKPRYTTDETLWFGEALAGAGDVNADGFADLVVGAPGEDNGSVYLLYGAACLDQWWPDADGDGWGENGGLVTDCYPPDGYALQDGDCDDSDPSIHLGADETADDGIDSDCDGEDGTEEPGPDTAQEMDTDEEDEDSADDAVPADDGPKESCEGCSTGLPAGAWLLAALIACRRRTR